MSRAGQTEKRTGGRGYRRARGSMSAGEILDAARHLIERDGLRRLSMQSLAQELGSGVTSVYWYFGSKEDLLEALAAAVFNEMHERLPDVGDGPWADELLRYFVVFRELLERYPIYREIAAFKANLLFRAPAGDIVMQRVEQAFSLLARAGLTHDEAAGVFSSCANYTRGFVVLEHGSDANPLGVPEGVEDFVRLDDEHFLLGLKLLIAGVRAQYRLDAEQARGPQRAL